MSSLPSSSHLQNPTPTLTLQQQAGYLDRIGTSHSPTSIKHDRDTLTLLTTLHITHIPFENLLIHRSLPYSLFVEHLYHKIVTLRQGGFCFELNGLFGCLLHSVGFSVRFVETCVNRGQHEDIMRGWDPWTHLLLIVTLQDQHYAVDVGFGTPPLQPLVISPRLEQTLSDGFKYRVTTSRPEFHTIDYAPLDYHPASDGGRVNHTDTVDQTADDYLIFERWSVRKQAWVPRIMIHARLQNRVFPEYFLSALDRVLHPTSIFRAAVLVCLIPRAHVLWTVSGLRLLESVTPYGERVETTLDENQAMEVLKDRFGIDFAKDEYAGTNPIHFGRGGVGYEPPKSTPTTAAETATATPTAPTTATQ